jgi:hypothetical protein
VLYLRRFLPARLALKRFRGEPAISGFDWHFTPIHSSSQAFSTTTWFGPPLRLISASPWPWIDHPVSGLSVATAALFRLGFPTAPALSRLNLAATANSPVRSTKSTPSRYTSALTVCRHTVSGSLSLPSRGAFHLSLAVLVHYRSPGVFSLGAWAPRLPTGFLVPGGTLDRPSLRSPFRLRGFHPLRPLFPEPSAREASTAVRCNAPWPSTTPALQRLQAYTELVWALPLSLATTQGISVDFFSSGYLDVSVPPVPLVRLWIHRTIPPFGAVGFPIRTSPDQRLLAAPRGISSLATSFFGSWRQGIRRAPFFAVWNSSPFQI